MANAIQNKITQDALGRSNSLSDKYFSGDSTSDFGLGQDTTSAADTGTYGINASDYVADSQTSPSFLDKAFNSDNFGVTLGGVGAAIKGVASIYDSYNNKEYKDKIYNLEKNRVDREVAKQEKAQAALEAAWS